MLPTEPNEFVIQRIWLAPGKGAALQIQHVPTGISVQRDIGYDSDDTHRAELLKELKRKLQVNADGPEQED